MKLCVACSQSFSSGDWRCPACGFAPRTANGFPSFAEAAAGDGFRPEFFAELAQLEAGHFWFRARNRLIIWALRRYFPELQSLLEIGCGTGYVLSGVAHAFPQARLAGSEYFIEGLPFAAARLPQATLYQMDARRLPFVDEFDVIGAFDVLEHIVEDEQVLVQLHRAVRPGGGIVLTVPQHPWLWSRSDDQACHLRRYRAAELRDKVTAAGFRVVYSTSFVSLLLPALFFSRRGTGKAVPAVDSRTELRLPPLLNGCFAVVMAVEYVLIRCGLCFPAGGSLLLVGQKSASGA